MQVGEIAQAHMGGVPELLTLVIPVGLFFIVRRIQRLREKRKVKRGA